MNEPVGVQINDPNFLLRELQELQLAAASLRFPRQTGRALAREERGPISQSQLSDGRGSALYEALCEHLEE